MGNKKFPPLFTESPAVKQRFPSEMVTEPTHNKESHVSLGERKTPNTRVRFFPTLARGFGAAPQGHGADAAKPWGSTSSPHHGQLQLWFTAFFLCPP